MKNLIVAAIAFVSLSSSAMNMQIGYPVDASRMSLKGEVEFIVRCDTKDIEFIKSSSYIFVKHIKKNVHVMCYRENATYRVTMNFSNGKLGRDDMIASQTSRYMFDDANVN